MHIPFDISQSLISSAIFFYEMTIVVLEAATILGVVLMSLSLLYLDLMN